jgi:predicted metal-dependent phosphoesterase TrpH
MNEWEWNGSRWWKFDFHTHTPASEDYGKGPNQRELKNRTPKEWLLDYMRAGIDCVTVTDHNSGAWIDRLKGALSELENESHADFRPIHLFPGKEFMPCFFF